MQEGALKIDRIVAAVDCGLIINPQGAEAQIQGGIIEGISAALMGEITVKNGEVQQSNFHDYPICRMHQVPTIDVHFIKSTDDPRGLGERSRYELNRLVTGDIKITISRNIGWLE